MKARRLRRAAQAVGVFACALHVWAQPVAAQLAAGANQIYRTAEGRAREAFEMDHPNRLVLEDTERLAASLQIAPGEVVADIGTGVGYLLPYLVPAVGPQGRVIAEDIYPDLLSKTEKRVKDNAWGNVDVVLGTERDPNLPIGAVDLAVAVDVYHHLDYPTEMLAHIREALKPAGRLVIVEFYLSRPHPRASEQDLRMHIRLDRDEVVQEVEEQGFRQIARFDHFPYQYVAIFGKQ